MLVFLRTRTGRDFSCYKRATILRRIARRMQVNGVDDLPAYLSYLRTHPGEAGGLLQDLLISVTNFFRDRDAFEALEAYLPELFRNKSQSDAVRVWVPACATGEEAYSLAICSWSTSAMPRPAQPCKFLPAISTKRQFRTRGPDTIPRSITADLSEERLRRFFVKDHNGYRVRRELREMVLFATHDLLKDAPFSRMDLISCRNLLIYLNRDLPSNACSRRFISHSSPAGRLFLGSSEAVEDDNPLFRVLDKKHRIYLQQPTGPRPVFRSPPGRARSPAGLELHDAARFGTGGARQAIRPGRGRLFRCQAFDQTSIELPWQRCTSSSSSGYASPSVIVTAEHEIVHLSEHAGDFLKFTGGEPTAESAAESCNPALRVELRTALFRAAETELPVETLDIPAEIDGEALSG